MKASIFISLFNTIVSIAGVLSAPLPALRDAPNNPPMGFQSHSEPSFFLLDTPQLDSQYSQPQPGAFIISPVPSGPSPYSREQSEKSELAQALPQFFSFVESLMVIMYNVARPEPPHRVSPNYQNSFILPTSFHPSDSRISVPNFSTHHIPLPPSYYYSEYPQEQQPSVYANGDSAFMGSVAGRSGDSSGTRRTDPSVKSLTFSRNLDKYCVFQGVSAFYPHDCFKYLICIPTKYNRFEAFVAHCPDDKRFSSTYRRCVQPYLVPECLGNSQPRIVSYHLADHKQLSPLKTSTYSLGPDIQEEQINPDYYSFKKVDDEDDTVDTPAAVPTLQSAAYHHVVNRENELVNHPTLLPLPATAEKEIILNMEQSAAIPAVTNIPTASYNSEQTSDTQNSYTNAT